MNATGMLRDGALQGKTIIVTGGGTGLGKSITRYLLTLGANVTICSRRQSVIDETAAELTTELSSVEGAGRILAVPCDVRNPQEIETVLAQTIDPAKRLDGLGQHRFNLLRVTYVTGHRQYPPGPLDRT